ncbi:MAG: AmmeMemoRadiSam system protein B [Candidatus Hydrogenedentes bacterium]|nr:AmmeMemoRadiSam system protein B [Candidatus Hydrogenedentota bacterium]
MPTTMIRRPAVAGQFYPGEPDDLRDTVDSYLDAADVDPAPERVVTIVSPHAGYIYSGPTAGHAFARVRGKKPRRVVLIGCSHRYAIDSASVFASGEFMTPIGAFPVDEAFARALAGTIDSVSIEPHLPEHSLEVQLPFLARAIGLVPIVPVLFGSQAGPWHANAGEAIARMLDPDDLVVASTDLSHYLNEASANAIDRRSINAVLTKDWKAYAQGIRDRSCAMCGAAAVTAAMACAAALDAREWKLLDYRTSSAASGDYDRVVGYAAISMERAA